MEAKAKAVLGWFVSSLEWIGAQSVFVQVVLGLVAFFIVLPVSTVALVLIFSDSPTRNPSSALLGDYSLRDEMAALDMAEDAAPEGYSPSST